MNKSIEFKKKNNSLRNKMAKTGEQMRSNSIASNEQQLKIATNEQQQKSQERFEKLNVPILEAKKKENE